MFEARKAMFLYCVSPVHMGAGTALGAIDNPIQRERHTGHPNMAGSGIKGALRDVFEVEEKKRAEARAPEEGGQKLTNRIFGPCGEGTNASDHAGAISFADAQLVLFPVRSLKRSFVYATCPTALGRLQRLLVMAGVEEAQAWVIPSVDDDDCAVVEGSKAVSDESLILEAYQFTAKPDSKVAEMAFFLADKGLPQVDSMKYFGEKIESDLVVLSDERFNFFVRHATVVEPHVRINDESGTADDGGLFYTENLPPESLLVSMVMASKERFKKGAGDAGGLKAEDVLTRVEGPLNGKLVQIGGDATTGRGQIVLTFAGGA